MKKYLQVKTAGNETFLTYVTAASNGVLDVHTSFVAEGKFSFHIK